MTITLRRAGLVLATAALLIAPAMPASAASPVKAEGDCSLGSTWKLTVSPDNGQLRIRYEVDSDVDGQLWPFGVNSGNGALIAAGRQITTNGGSFRVELIAPDVAGPDRVVAKARNQTTGETCTGALTV